MTIVIYFNSCCDRNLILKYILKHNKNNQDFFIYSFHIYKDTPCFNSTFFVFGMLLQKVPGIFFLANMQHICFLFKPKDLPAYRGSPSQPALKTRDKY